MIVIRLDFGWLITDADTRRDFEFNLTEREREVFAKGVEVERATQLVRQHGLVGKVALGKSFPDGTKAGVIPHEVMEEHFPELFQ